MRLCAGLRFDCLQSVRVLLGRAEQGALDATQAEELAESAQAALDKLLAGGQRQAFGLQAQVSLAVELGRQGSCLHTHMHLAQAPTQLQTQALIPCRLHKRCSDHSQSQDLCK